MTKDETLKIALEALENHEGNYKLGRAGCERQEAAITAIKEALAQSVQPEQEPVAWLYPEGFEALQAGKCWTAYPRSHEDCNIPLYIATPQQQQAEPPPEWPLIKNILAVFGLDAISFVAKWQAAQQQAEPVAWDKISAWSLREVYFDEDGEPSMHRSPPQRPWVGLTDEDRCKFAAAQYGWEDLCLAVEAKLKEKNI